MNCLSLPTPRYCPHDASLISEAGGHPPDRGLREPTHSTREREDALPAERRKLFHRRQPRIHRFFQGKSPMEMDT